MKLFGDEPGNVFDSYSDYLGGDDTSVPTEVDDIEVPEDRSEDFLGVTLSTSGGDRFESILDIMTRVIERATISRKGK